MKIAAATDFSRAAAPIGFMIFIFLEDRRDYTPNPRLLEPPPFLKLTELLYYTLFFHKMRGVVALAEGLVVQRHQVERDIGLNPLDTVFLERPLHGSDSLLAIPAPGQQL